MQIPSGLPPRTLEIASGATRKTPIATIGTASKGLSPGNNRGIRPATPVSPDYPAKTIEDQADRQNFYVGRFQAAVLNEVVRRQAAPPEPDMVEGEAEAIEIDTIYHRKLAGLRRLPKRERPHARKAAIDWRIQALKALREKHAIERHARRAFRKLSKLEFR
jgi:hypothetical protein